VIKIICSEKDWGVRGVMDIIGVRAGIRLRGRLMLKLLKPRISSEELFARNYDRLLGWALHLTGGDRPVAEDLLHDVFVLFSLQKLDLSVVENLDGYLYAMLRNLHISRLRRMTRARLRQLSILEFDSAERGLATLSAHDRIQIQDQLRAVCRYACARKERAKDACVLILRFFHGYYPSEVARVLKTTRRAVDLRLLHARQEAKLVIENPRAVVDAGGAGEVAVIPANFARPTGDFLEELRQAIFSSRRGECLTGESLKGLYRSGSEAAPAHSQLAHVVSCRDCLDEVNRLLSIPTLAERHPADFVKREPPRGGGGHGGGGTGGRPPAQSLKRLRRSAGEVFEHQPQELCVSVNGYERGSQRINSETSELNLVLDVAEPLSFVEVFSEQEVRLLMLPVTPPPAGEGEQSLDVGLSDGRRLELRLKFQSPWPTLQVLYRDPTFKESSESAAASHAPEPFTAKPAPSAASVGADDTGRQLEGPLAWLLRRLSGRGFWLRPGVATALAALMLASALLVWRAHLRPHVSAAELLGRAAHAEESAGRDAETVQYRTIQLEERRGAGGAVVKRRRVEIWKGAAKGATARRLYDERGKLVAGEWRAPDGSRTFYRAPRPDAPPADGPARKWNLDTVWQFEPSAKDFTALIGRPDAARAEEGRDHFSVTYEAGVETATPDLVSATLLLERRSLRAFEQTLTVREGGELIQFRFIEMTYERRPKDSVAPHVFEPDDEFVEAGTIRVETDAGTAPAAGDTRRESSAPTPAPAAASGATAATAALEVEVLSLLRRAGADLGEQVSVTRTPDGLLHVRAVAENGSRRDELLQALEPVSGEPSVRIEVVDNEAEYLRRGRLSNLNSVRRVEPSAEGVPADEELRRHLLRGGREGDALEADVISFSMRVSARSRNALQHAWALKRLAERFSPSELNALDQSARAKWLSLLREHAAAVGLEAAALRQELQPVFHPSGAPPSGDAGAGPESEADFAASAERLLALCSSFDTAIRSAFTASAHRASDAGVKSPQFWRALRGAEALAGRMRRAAERLSNVPAVRRRVEAPAAEPARPPRDKPPSGAAGDGG
jgi:RNA polymerase sigma factor (sigma-70 family)